jgi:hypothetical protein
MLAAKPQYDCIENPDDKKKVHLSKFTSDAALIKLRRQRAGNEEFFAGLSYTGSCPA